MVGMIVPEYTLDGVQKGFREIFRPVVPGHAHVELAGESHQAAEQTQMAFSLKEEGI